MQNIIQKIQEMKIIIISILMLITSCGKYWYPESINIDTEYYPEYDFELLSDGMILIRDLYDGRIFYIHSKDFDKFLIYTNQ